MAIRFIGRNYLEEGIETYHAEAGSPTYCEQVATDLTAVLGGVRGLLDVMAETDREIHDVGCAQ